LLLDAPKILAQAEAQGGVQLRERFIQEIDLRATDNSSAESHALALTSRQVLGKSVQAVADFQEIGSLVHALPEFGGVDFPEAEAQGEILTRCKVGIQRGLLKGHGHFAIFRRQRKEVPAGEKKAAGVGLLQPGDHAHQGSFAGAGRPDQGRQFTGPGGEIHRAQGLDHVAPGSSEGFGDVFQNYV
jgi:hypothetical protein